MKITIRERCEVIEQNADFVSVADQNYDITVVASDGTVYTRTVSDRLYGYEADNYSGSDNSWKYEYNSLEAYDDAGRDNKSLDSAVYWLATECDVKKTYRVANKETGLTTVHHTFGKLRDEFGLDTTITYLDEIVEHLAAEYNGSECPYTLSECYYIAYKYKDDGGYGESLDCESELDAIRTAQTGWDRLTRAEQKAYKNDPAGEFTAKFQVYTPPQNGEQESYEDVILWDALENRVITVKSRGDSLEVRIGDKCYAFSTEDWDEYTEEENFDGVIDELDADSTLYLSHDEREELEDKLIPILEEKSMEV